MPKNLSLAVSIKASLASSFRAAMDAAQAGLRGVRSAARRQAEAVRAGAAASGELARASSLARQTAAGVGPAAAGSFRQAGDTAGSVGGQVDRLSGRTAALSGTAREFDKAFSYAADSAKNALAGTTKASELLAKKQKALHDYLKRTNIEAGNRSRAEAAMRALGRRQVELKRNEEALARAMDRTNAIAEKRGRIFADMGKLSMQSAALLAPAGMAVKTAATKQDTIRDIAITGGMSTEDETQLSLAVRDIARESNQYQTDVLQGMQVLTAGGVQSRKELEEYGAVLARTATATRASMDDLGATTLALRDNLDITAEGLNESFNILAAGGKAGLVELKDMAKYLPQIAPTFASMGITGQQAVAEMTAGLQIARRGAGTNDEAATNMRNYLQKIFAPDTVQNFADAGIDLQASLKQLAKDGIGPFEGTMRLVMEYMKSQSPQAAAEFKKAMQIEDEAKREQALQRIQEAYALSDLFRDMQAMNFLRPLVMQMEDYKKIKAEALEAGKQDVLGKDFDKRMASPVEQAKRLRVEFDLAAESLGKALLPSALAVGESLLPLIQRGAAWIEQNQETVALVARVTAGLLAFRGGLLALRLGFTLLGGPLVSAAVKFLTFRSMLSAGVRPMQALLRLFGMSPRAAALLAGGLGKAGNAVRRLGPLLLQAGRFSGGVLSRGFTQGGKAAAWLGSGILKLGRVLSGALVKGLSLAGKAVLWLGRALLLNPVGLLVTGIAVAAYLIYRNWDKIKAAFSAGWNWLKGLGPRLMQQGRELTASIFPEGGIGPALEAGWNTVKAKFEGGMAWIRGLPGQFLDMGRNVATGLVDGIKSGIDAAGDAITGMAESVKNKFKGWLGIASPSRVFAGYGLNVAEGAALGIRAGEGEAAGAAAGLAKAAAKGWTPPELSALQSGAGEALSRLATWGKALFAGMFPALRLPALNASGVSEPGWQPPKLLTDADGPAKIAAASRADSRNSPGRNPAAGMTVHFSPSVTIQGNATEKDVKNALSMTLPELERMLRRLMHDERRRAYV